MAPVGIRARRTTLRGRALSLCAVAAVAAFAGTAVAAPFSLPQAGAETGAVRYNAVADHQALIAHKTDGPALGNLMIDTAISAEAAAGKASSAKGAEMTLDQFMFSGAVNWGGYRFTYYSQQVLPGPGLAIPGRHVSDAGYVADADGFIVLAGSHPKGTVFDTPFGAQGKIYDRGTFGNHLDVYIR